ncbi:MAG TPA: cytochrome P450 [Candidatus Polarisedimenticolia bacterium]|nr:cytochrome P450 [Candidatus Polarisedimenticolia bacterium]
MATASASAPKTLSGNAPGPKGRFLIGSLIEISRDWLGFYKNCADQYGDVVRVHLAHVPVYLVVHPRDIETVLVTNAAKFTKSEDYRALARVLGRGLLTSEGDFWRRQRSLIQPAFHRQSILAYAEVMTRAAGRMLDSWNEKSERNIHEDLMRVTLEIVGQCLYGAEVTNAAERVGHAMEVVTGRFIINASLAMLFRFDIPVRLAIREWRAIRELNEIIGGIIRERRSSDQPREDLLDMLLRARDADGNPMSDTQLRDEVMTLFLAGHETTAIALSWACYLICQNADIEARLAEELQTVLGGRVPTPEDLPRLRYTEMVLKETMRLYPAVWGIGRRAMEDCELGGYRVPAGSNVFILQWRTQRDARFFPDPDRFDPERWREDPVRSGKIPRFAYFPFGGGPRVCVGASFAMMEATLLLAMIQQRFHLEVVPGHPIEIFASVTLRPKYGIRVIPRRRTVNEKSSQGT